MKTLFAAVIFSAHLTSAHAGPVVRTESGPVEGREKSSVRVYLGIPYAASTAGDHRWKAPQPVASWRQTFKADKVGPECPQAKSFGPDSKIEGDEDCLSLNVWAPKNATAAPVMVFIHGGFYVRGSSDQEYALGTKPQDGLPLARDQGVVVVSMNYRLGPLGFFVSPALDDGSSENRSGNYGLLDQLAALKWVAKNIAAFGGDPAKVTVFGESAGASSILNLIASPVAKGSFSRAIIESGYFKALPREKMAAMSGNLAKQAGCSQESPTQLSDCLKALPMEKVIHSAPTSAQAGAEALFVPNQDGWLIPEPLRDAYSSGRINVMPVVLGTNTQEASNLAYALYGDPVKTDAELEAKVIASYGREIWEKVKPIYGDAALGDPQERLIQVGTDGIFTCQGNQIAAWLNAAGAETRRYVFSHTIPVPGFKAYGAAHGFELNYAVGGPPAVLGALLPKADKELGREMQGLWAGFAQAKELKLQDGSSWTPYTGAANWSADFVGSASVVSRMIPEYRKDRCAVLDAAVPVR